MDRTESNCTEPADRTEAKRRAALEALSFVRDGMTLGLGTGSTAALMIEELGRRVHDGLRVRGVPTSERTAELARRAGVPLTTFADAFPLDLAIDGADEILADGSAIKGGGGALCREKIVAAATAGPRIAVVDEAKWVDRLGEFPLPVEVLPFALPAAVRWIEELGARVARRFAAPGQPYVTDNGNEILDCRFGARADWDELAAQLDSLPGILCHGYFARCFDVIVVGSASGVETRRAERRTR